ncbi:MAG: tripartite tricarboxylate transporter substrate binding protein [Candidatus Accumulibacter sp.]|nr:tripartite tricarboxylate transporter substrate binding protein [Accumulibacter sp.]
MRTHTVFMALCATVLSLTLGAGAQAADAGKWPERPIQIIVPYGAGGDSDFNARVYAKYLEPLLGKPLAVVNVTGGGGSIAARRAKDAKPDGYTVFFGNGGFEIGHAIGLTDFGFEAFEVAAIAARESGHYIAVNASSPWKTLKELVEDSKKQPGKISIAGSIGGASYLAAVLLNKNGAALNIVDHGGSATRITALLGNHVDAVPTPMVTLKDYVKNGDMRVLATMAPKRSRFVPDVPTFLESGYPAEYQFCFYFMFPKGTPQAIVDKFAEAAEKIATTNKEYADALEKSFMQEVFFLRGKEAWKLIQSQVDIVTKADLRAK